MTALEAYLAGVPAAEQLPEQTKYATETQARLRPQLFQLRIQGDRGAQYQVGDQPGQVLPADGTAVVWLEPGPHRVRHAGTEHEITGAAGAEVPLALRKAAPPEPPPALSRELVPAVQKPGRAAQGGAMRASKWVLFGVGLAAFGAGAGLLAIHGRPDCAPNEGQRHCPELWNTQGGGIGLVVGGGARAEHRGGPLRAGCTSQARAQRRADQRRQAITCATSCVPCARSGHWG